DAADRAGGTDRLIPVTEAEAARDRLQLPARGEDGLVVIAPVQPAIREILATERNTAHIKAFQLLRFRAADDEFGGAAADIHDQTGLVAGSEIARHPQIDQARLLDTADDVDRYTQRLFRQREKHIAILGRPQGVGADHPHTRGRDATQALAQSTERGDRLVHHRPTQGAVGLQTGTDPHRLLETIDDDQLAALAARDQQMKTVRTKIQCRINIA